MPKQVSYVKSSGGWFFKPDAGWYPAIIVWVVELWTEWKDYKKDWNIKDVEEIRIVYEIEAEQEKQEKDDNDNYVWTWEMEMKIGTIGQNYTTIISDNSKLWKIVKAIYGVKSMEEIKNFSLDKLLWVKCYIDVDLVWKEKNFPVVKSASALNKKFEKMLHTQETEWFYFWMDDADDFIDWFEETLKVHLPTWEVDRIKASPEYRGLMKKFWIEVPKSLEEDEADIEKEIANNKAGKPEVKSEELSQDVADEIFSEEPETTTKARENAKSQEEPKAEWDDPFNK